MTLISQFRSLLEKFTDHIPPVGDSDVRSLLDQQLFAMEPGFLGVVEVFSETSQVVYAVAPEGVEKHVRRSFEIVDGAPQLKGEAEEVQLRTKFEPVTLAEKIVEKDGKFCCTKEGKETCYATRAEAKAALKMKAASTDDCGCGGGKKTADAPATIKEEDVNKKQRVAALIAILSLNKKPLFGEADAPVLETLSDERLKALEDAAGAKVEEVVVAPVAKELTPDEMLAKMPDVQAIVTEHKALSAAKKVAAIALITASAAHKDVYTAAELEAMPLASLEKLGKMVAASATVVKIDQSGRGGPRVEPGPDAPPPPIDMNARILARSKSAS